MALSSLYQTHGDEKKRSKIWTDEWLSAHTHYGHWFFLKQFSILLLLLVIHLKYFVTRDLEVTSKKLSKSQNFLLFYSLTPSLISSLTLTSCVKMTSWMYRFQFALGYEVDLLLEITEGSKRIWRKGWSWHFHFLVHQTTIIILIVVMAWFLESFVVKKGKINWVCLRKYIWLLWLFQQRGGKYLFFCKISFPW